MADRSAPIRTAVIPAAGLGTRMLPMTRALPKELLPVVDRPVLQWVVDEARASGIQRIVFIVSQSKAAIREHFTADDQLIEQLTLGGKADLAEAVAAIGRDMRFEYVNQERQLGLGHAILTARQQVGDEPFAVMLGDTIIAHDTDAPAGLQQLIDVYQQTGGAVVSVRQVPREWVSRYGIVDGEPSADDPRLYRLKRLIEKPSPDKAPTDLAIAGRYVFTPAIFDELAEQKPGVGGEIQLTDAMNALAGRPDQTMSAYRWRATRYDIGNQLDYLQCCIALGLADPRIGEKLRGFVTKVVSE